MNLISSLVHKMSNWVKKLRFFLSPFLLEPLNLWGIFFACYDDLHTTSAIYPRLQIAPIFRLVSCQEDALKKADTSVSDFRSELDNNNHTWQLFERSPKIGSFQTTMANLSFGGLSAAYSTNFDCRSRFHLVEERIRIFPKAYSSRVS